MCKEYPTIKEVAQELGIAEQTVRNYIVEGMFESEKIYNSTVISKDQVDKYKNNRGVE